jgi:hypothetical protein
MIGNRRDGKLESFEEIIVIEPSGDTSEDGRQLITWVCFKQKWFTENSAARVFTGELNCELNSSLALCWLLTLGLLQL